MYSIIHLYDNGYKVRYASSNLNDIYEKYQKLNSIITDSNKMIIFDNEKNNHISLEQLKILMKISETDQH